MLPDDDERHGKRAGYVAGCRCRPCTDACARYQNERLLDAMRGEPRTVPLEGTRRRVKALQRMGWSAEYLSERLGYSRAWLNITVNQNGGGKIYRRNFEKIAAIYDELCMTPGPSSITRKRAEKAGWPGPLDWDDIDNDEAPNNGHEESFTRSAIDHAVVWRVLHGEVLPTNTAERREIMRRWLATGGSEKSLCVRMGWKDGRYSLGSVGESGDASRDEREAS